MLRVNPPADLLPTPAGLDYAPAPSRRHRYIRRATWWVFWAALGTLSIAVAWRAANQVHYLWLQHQLMGYNVPDGPMRVGSKGAVQNAPAWPAPKVHKYSNPYPFYPVFIHERISPSGARRLIIVSDYVTAESCALLGQALVPATIKLGSEAVSHVPLPFSLHHGAWNVHGGRADPDNNSHFTIIYETERGKGTIDGWLINDDDVTLEVRDGPLR